MIFRTKRRLRPVQAALLLLPPLLAVVACSGSPGGANAEAGATGGNDKVTFRYQSGASYGSISPFELADKLGYYKGTSVVLKSVGVSKSGPEDIQAIAAGSNDIAWTNTAPIINASVHGIGVKAIVAAGTTLTRDLDGDTISIGGLLARKSSGIRSAKDLEGKKVSVNVRSAQAEYAIRKWMGDHGADGDKVDYVVIAPPNEVQALAQGQIDAVYNWSPGYNKAQEISGVDVIASEGDMLGDFVTGGFAFSEQFLDAHPAAVKEFVAGYVKAWTWAWEHPKELQATAAEIIKEDDGDPSLSKFAYPFGSRKNALINDADINFYITQLEKSGDLEKGEAKASDFYTNAFNPHANG
jgi:ABC-type nitrate/sulfonate/bicarbonate transport system substrate-binding protein